MKKYLLATILLAAVLLWGCSSKPSPEEVALEQINKEYETQKIISVATAEVKKQGDQTLVAVVVCVEAPRGIKGPSVIPNPPRFIVVDENNGDPKARVDLPLKWAPLVTNELNNLPGNIKNKLSREIDPRCARSSVW